MWGKVKLDVMKFPTALQALSSIQAYRIDLKAYGQIGVSERGKVGTLPKGQIHARRCKESCNG